LSLIFLANYPVFEYPGRNSILSLLWNTFRVKTETKWLFEKDLFFKEFRKRSL